MVMTGLLFRLHLVFSFSNLFNHPAASKQASARDVCVTDDTEKSNRERIAIQSRSKQRKKKNSRRRRWEAYASIGGQSEKEHHPESSIKLPHLFK